jgi:hypothetical protein
MRPKTAFLWAYFGPKFVACFPALGTTTPIVREETYISSLYTDLWCKWEGAHSTEEQRRRDQKYENKQTVALPHLWWKVLFVRPGDIPENLLLTKTSVASKRVGLQTNLTTL